MKKLMLILSIMMVTCLNSFAHTEILGSVSITNYEDELYMKVALDKNFLVNILKKEGTCIKENMIKVCGSNYFLNHFQISTNSVEKKPEQVSFEILKNQIVFIYKMKAPKKINQIEIGSDYTLKYNSHGIVRVAFKIDDNKIKSYDLGIKRKMIQAKFN